MAAPPDIAWRPTITWNTTFPEHSAYNLRRLVVF